MIIRRYDGKLDASQGLAVWLAFMVSMLDMRLEFGYLSAEVEDGSPSRYGAELRLSWFRLLPLRYKHGL